MTIFSFYAMLKYSISNNIFCFVSVFILHHSYSKRIIEKCFILIYQIIYTDKKTEVKVEVLMKRYNEVILFASHQLLVTSHQLLVTSNQSLVASYQSLVANYQSLVASYQSLVATYQSPVASYQSLVATYQSLVASYQLLVTSYQLLVTSCQSLIASHELRNNTSHQFLVNSFSQKYICQGYSREIVGDVLCLLMLIPF